MPIATEKPTSINSEGAIKAGFDIPNLGWRFFLKFTVLLAFFHLLLGSFKEASHYYDFSSKGDFSSYFGGQLTREFNIWLSQIEPVHFLIGVFICAPLFLSLYSMLIRKCANDNETGFLGLALGKLELNYFVINFIKHFSFSIILLPLFLMLHFSEDMSIPFQLLFALTFAFLVAFIPISARLHYAAIGTILAPHLSYRELWQKSKRNGWNLFFLEIGSAIIIGIILFLITIACAFLFRIRMSSFESLLEAGFSISYVLSSYKLTVVPIFAAAFESIRLCFLTKIRTNAFKQLLAQ